MGWYAEPWYIDTDNAHAIYCIGQQTKWNTAGSRHAQVGDDDGIVFFRIGHLLDGFLDIFEKLAGDQSLRTERDIANAAPRTIEVRRKRQAIYAAGRTREDRRGAPHPQANPKRAECRAHRLWLVVRAERIVLGILIEYLGLASLLRGIAHGVF